MDIDGPYNPTTIRTSGNTTASFAYNEITDLWEAVGDMPTARRLALVAILNGKIMVVGGSCGAYMVEANIDWRGTHAVEILF